MKWIAILLFILFARTGIAQSGDALYDSNPGHPWNLLNKSLFERTDSAGRQYGLNTLDILYWARTTNLLAGASHQQALNALDHFIHSHDEKLIHEPLKKALLQRDLWALFDWAAGGLGADHKIERAELLKRLAILIRRLELTTNEIASLPDNYSLAEKNNLSDLPRELFNTNGHWINISIPNAFGLVPAHDLSFGGRSLFMVLFHDADGRNAGLNYLKQLAAVEPMFVPSGDAGNPDHLTFNHFPQFPANSQWALVRRMRVIDTEGKIRTTRIVESIQLRTYLGFGEPEFAAVTNANGTVGTRTIPPQRFNEFQMTRPSAQMISLGHNERDFIKIPFSKGFDAFEFPGFGHEQSSGVTNNLPIVLQTCVQCHSGPGIYSVNSFTRLLSLEPRRAETTQMVESDGSSDSPTGLFSQAEIRSQWGLLQGLWMQIN